MLEIARLYATISNVAHSQHRAAITVGAGFLGSAILAVRHHVTQDSFYVINRRQVSDIVGEHCRPQHNRIDGVLFPEPLDLLDSPQALLDARDYALLLI